MLPGWQSGFSGDKNAHWIPFVPDAQDNTDWFVHV
jgi:hypothetical protein